MLETAIIAPFISDHDAGFEKGTREARFSQSQKVLNLRNGAVRPAFLKSRNW